MAGIGEITEFRAAQNVRLSTEYPQYLTHIQSNKIREYTEKRSIEIIKTYADDDKSGLTTGGRTAPQQLIADVESGAFSRMRMKAPSTDTPASAPATTSPIAPSACKRARRDQGRAEE